MEGHLPPACCVPTPVSGMCERSDSCLYSVLSFSPSVVSDSLWPHGLQHARLPCPSPTPGACSNSCPLSWWCHPTISSSVIPFFFCLQSFSALGSSVLMCLFLLLFPLPEEIFLERYCKDWCPRACGHIFFQDVYGFRSNSQVFYPFQLIFVYSVRQQLSFIFKTWKL